MKKNKTILYQNIASRVQKEPATFFVFLNSFFTIFQRIKSLCILGLFSALSRLV